MKNIFEILKALGVEVPKEKEDELKKEVSENYKTVADYEKQTEKIQKLTDTQKASDDTVADLKKQLDGFKDVDVSALNQKIADLETEKGNIEKDYQSKLADRDFNDILKDSISAAKGKNAKAISALLDIDTIKASKNQKDDLAKALKELSEAEDSKMLFGESDPVPQGRSNIIGAVQKPSDNSSDAQLRAVMGLPPMPKTEGVNK